MPLDLPFPLRFRGYFEAPLFRTFFISLGTSKYRGSTVCHKHFMNSSPCIIWTEELEIAVVVMLLIIVVRG